MIYYFTCCIGTWTYSPIGGDYHSHNGSYNPISSPSLTTHQNQGMALGESNNHASISNSNSSDISKAPQQYNPSNNSNSPLLSPPPPPPPPSALSTLLQHHPPPLFPPGSCGASMENSHHQSSPISVVSGIHEIMMHHQSAVSPTNITNQINDPATHLIPPPLNSNASTSSDCYSPLGSHARSQESPNRIGMNNNGHNIHHPDQSHHSISHLEHHLQQLQQPKHNPEPSHSSQQQEDNVYSHAPEYISL